MKQILDYLKIEKLGALVLPPFEKFEGLMAAKVSRRNSESFVVAKWNGDFLTPDVAFDPNANFGMVDEFLELYSNEEASESNINQNSIDVAFDTFSSLEDENELITEDAPDGNFELTDNEEIDEELGGEDLEIDLVIAQKESEGEAPKEVFPIFETLKGAELSEWLLSHSVAHKSTFSKPEKVKLCEKYVADLAKSE